jgi:hypothetical protein
MPSLPPFTFDCRFRKARFGILQASRLSETLHATPYLYKPGGEIVGQLVAQLDIRILVLPQAGEDLDKRFETFDQNNVKRIGNRLGEMASSVGMRTHNESVRRKR